MSICMRGCLSEAGSSASHIADCGSQVLDGVLEECDDDLLEEALCEQRAQHEQHCHDTKASEAEEDDWLQELLTCHHPAYLALGAGSPAPGSHHSNLPEACSSARPEACSSVSHGCRTVHLGLSDACSSASHIVHCSSKTEARRVFISETESLGALPHVSIPEQFDVVLWNDGIGKALDPMKWGSQRLAAWLRTMGPAIFKCGIAADPVDRYFNGNYGYAVEDRWHFMDVFWEGPANQCRQVEIEFISVTRGVEGCCNESRGGEGVRADRTHQCYVYLVLASAGHGISLKQSRCLRVAGGRGVLSS